MNSEKIIEVKNLTVGYKGSTVLEDISFSVNKGEVFGILGGSGCGKSTILKHMIGLYRPITGDIFINGVNIVTAAEEEKSELTKQFGVLFQSGALFSSLNLEENVTLPLEEFSDLPKDVISSLAKVKLSMVGLQGFEKYSPFELSGGMCKRAALARAMALDPDILFFDEPSAGLDPISSADLDRLILHLKKTTNSTMIIVTHELDSVFTVADRIIILDKNSKGIVAEGNPKDIVKTTTNPKVKEFLTRSSEYPISNKELSISK